MALERQRAASIGGVIRLRAERGKNKRPRTLVLRGALLDLIAARVAVRRLDVPYVFHRAGGPLGGFGKRWHAACRAAGVQGRVFHDMRGSAIRNMVRGGVPERVAMAVSGHKTRAVFDRYNIVSEADLAAAAEKMTTYVEQANGRTVTPLRPASGEHAQSTHRSG